MEHEGSFTTLQWFVEDAVVGVLGCVDLRCVQIPRAAALVGSELPVGCLSGPGVIGGAQAEILIQLRELKVVSAL